jgi:hypothetical protein
MFVLRDPISRFVSAFNGRLREDRPRYHYPWHEEERMAFALFTTPDELATALSSTDHVRRTQAERAMRGIGHVNTPYAHWFGDLHSFRRRLSDVFFIGFQDQLDDDFELLKEKLGLHRRARLPTDPVAAHRSTTSNDGYLSVVARANLERWYAADLAFVDFCHELAPLVNLEQVPRQRRSRAQAGEPSDRSPFEADAGILGRRRARPARLLLAPFAGIAAFATAAGLVEVFTDRDWSLSGLEWPAGFATATLLVCLVAVVGGVVKTLGDNRHRGTSTVKHP